MKTKGSSKLIFDGKAHQLSLTDTEGKTVGAWPAYNNVDSHATIRALKNQIYIVQDKIKPLHHKADPNGPYGSYGIIRFNVSGHPGIGVHSGRANAKHKPGPQHATMGCIRTTDAAMHEITEYMRRHPLSVIEIKHNDVSIAKHSSQKNAHIGHISHVHDHKH